MSNPEFAPPPLPADPPYTPPASLTEYQYHSQFSTDQIGIVINQSGVPTDVDNQTMTITAWALPQPGTQNPPPPTQVWTAAATRSAPGVYEYNLTSSNTGQPGYYRLDWTFTLSGTPETTSTFIEIGPPSPAYDSLPFVARQIVEQVWADFADSFDSPYGGPYLQMWFNTNFGRGRVAQLLIQAVWIINNAAQPPQLYDITGQSGPMFPVTQWQGLLISALRVEVIKHLMRSYVEDPDIQGAVQARMIRRDYLSRWGQMLDIEYREYKEQRDVWKIQAMFQCTPRVLISGGVFGNFGPVRQVGNLVARPIYWFRFYALLLILAAGLTGASIGLWHDQGSKTPPDVSGQRLTAQVAPMHVGPWRFPQEKVMQTYGHSITLIS